MAPDSSLSPVAARFFTLSLFHFFTFFTFFTP